MGYISLEPKKPIEDRRIPGFGVGDIEAADWVKFLLNGYYTKVYNEDGSLQKEIFEQFKRTEEFADFVFSDEQPHNTIFFHFGGGYDFNFLLKDFYYDPRFYIHDMIPRQPGILCFSVSTHKQLDYLPEKFAKSKIIRQLKSGKWLVKDRTIIFRDSSALLSFKLATLTEKFKVLHRKKEIEFQNIKEVTPELIEYHGFDMKGLHEVIEEFYKWPVVRRAGFANTMASQSMRIFQNYMKEPIHSLSAECENFVRQSYYGGRTEIFKPWFEQKNVPLNSYDVNSLYPFIMKSCNFPVKFKHQVDRFIPDQMGFYDVDVFVPDMYIPPLGVDFVYQDGNKKFIFPTGCFRGCWSSVELEYAMTLGVKILKVHKGMVFYDGGPIFKEFITDIYDIRKNAKKDGDSVSDIICKLIMNAGYGRYGLRRDREKLVFDEGQLGITANGAAIDLGENKLFRLGSEPIFLEKAFSQVAIAAWVTSNSRIHMHKNILKCQDELYYMDTDSEYTTKILESNQDDLGALKFEDSYRWAAFINPKGYQLESLTAKHNTYDEISGKILKDKFGNQILTHRKTVMKGFDKRKTQNWSRDDFYQFLEGEKFLRARNPEKFARLKTATNKGKFLLLLPEADREVRSKYNKRRIIKRGDQVFDTEPLNIEGGVITNLPEAEIRKNKLRRKLYDNQKSLSL